MGMKRSLILMPSLFDFGSVILVLTCGVVAAWTARSIVNRRKRNPRRLPYAPGPKGHFLVGNLAQIPQKRAWDGYHEICREYGEPASNRSTLGRERYQSLSAGDIVRLEVLGTEILLLDSIKHARALLEERAVIYSDRPDFPVGQL